MRSIWFALAALLFTQLSGCAYNVQPTSTQAVNIYTTFDQKIKGKWILVIDPSVRDVNRQVKPSSYACAAHTYPVAGGDALTNSVRRTMSVIFDEVIEQSTLPSAETLASLGARGSIIVRLDEFAPKITCTPGFWSMSCAGQAEIGFSVVVRLGGEQVVNTQALGSKGSDGDAGAACGGAATVLAEAITRATRDALERLAERVANSQRLRG
jgi:hypothetical protein